MQKQLYEFLSQNKLLTPNQFGFRPRLSKKSLVGFNMARNERPTSRDFVGRSPKKASSIAKKSTCSKFSIQSLDKGGFTGAVLLDPSKAFDAVDHVLLVEKLKFIVASSQVVKWLASYLESRYQVTCVENCQSPEQKPPRVW